MDLLKIKMEININKDLFKNLFNKWFESEPIYKNECIKTKANPYYVNFHGNKKPKKDEYYDNSILLIESICDVNDNYYRQRFLEKTFKNRNNLIKQMVKINNESDDESDDN